MTEDDLAGEVERVLFEGAPAHVRSARLFLDIGLSRYDSTVSLRGGRLIDTTAEAQPSPIVQPHAATFPIYERYLSEKSAEQDDISVVELEFRRDEPASRFTWVCRALRLEGLRRIKDDVDPLLAQLRSEARACAPASEYVCVEFSVPPSRKAEKRLAVANGRVAHRPLTRAQDELLLQLRRTYLEHERWLYEVRLYFNLKEQDDDHWTGVDLISTGFFGDEERGALEREIQALHHAPPEADDSI